MSAAPKAAAPERAPYDQDSEDLARWLLKEHARKLLLKSVYKPKRVKEHYTDYKKVLAPSPDIEDAESFLLPVQRYRYIVSEIDTKDGPISEVKRACEFRVVNCCRDKIRKDQQPEVWWSKPTQRAGFQKVQVCGSVWTCPTCTRKINLQRQAHIRTAYELVINSAPLVHVEDVFEQVHDADALMVTFTIKHGHGDQLDDLLGLLKAADRHMQQNSRDYRRLVSRPLTGHVGRLTTTEMTHGRNGWHPHLHSLWFFDRRLGAAQIAAMRQELFSAWRAACVAVGLPAPEEFTPDGKPLGVHLVRALTAEEYFSKHGTFERPDSISKDGTVAEQKRKWSVEREMANGHVKKARKSGRSPFQLLYDSMEGDEQAGDLFRIYARATKGKHQLEFSHSLRKYLESLGYKDHLASDEELAAMHGDDSDLMGRIDDSDFDVMCNAKRYGEKNAFGEVLHICKHKGFPAAMRWLATLRRRGEQPRTSEFVDPETGEVMPGKGKRYEQGNGSEASDSCSDAGLQRQDRVADPVADQQRGSGRAGDRALVARGRVGSSASSVDRAARHLPPGGQQAGGHEDTVLTTLSPPNTHQNLRRISAHTAHGSA